MIAVATTGAASTTFRPCFIPLDSGNDNDNDPEGAAVNSLTPREVPSVALTQRYVSRKDKWRLERQAEDAHCRLDNLHLRLENYTQAHPDEVLSWWEPALANLPNLKPETASGVKKGRGRPKKIEVNRIKPYLQGFMFASDALSKLPMFNDIVSGTVVADAGGNTRPFSKKKMVHLLQSMDIISTEAIQEEMKCSTRHAQKLAMCLRIIERHAFDVAITCWKLPTETDWAGLD